jgi:hypothetical protein
MRKRIENQDHEAVFAHGGCFHFALRLYERFGYSLRGTRSAHDSTCWGHVWARKGNNGIDVRGVYPEELLSALANGGQPLEIRDVLPEEARAAIQKQEYPPALTNELFQLADRIVDTHERFQSVKPISPEAKALFDSVLNELANKPSEATPDQRSPTAPSPSSGAPPL